MSSSHRFGIPKPQINEHLRDANSTSSDYTEDTAILDYEKSVNCKSEYGTFPNDYFDNELSNKKIPEFSDDESCNEEYQHEDDDDFNSDIDDQDNGEEIQNITSEMSEDIKNQLIYSDNKLSVNHIFFVVNAEQAHVVKLKKQLQNLKMKVDKAKLENAQAQVSLEGKLREEEKQFVKLYIRKIMFDKSLPVVEPLPQKIRNNIYKNNNHHPHLLKVLPSTAQKKLKKNLKRQRFNINKMNAAENNHLGDMKNYLYQMEREYIDKFTVSKTPEDIEKDRTSQINSKQDYTSLNYSKKPWLRELTTGNMKQLMYTRAASTDNQMFWVDIRKKAVKQAKWQCFKLKQIFHELIAKGNKEEIKKAEKKYRERENYFVNTFVNKVQFDENVPKISPLPLELRNEIYNESNNFYRVQKSSQQGAMLKILKNLNESVRQLIKIGNKFAPSVANDLYHKEVEYKKSFLHCLDTVQEQQIFRAELSKPMNQRMKKIKREKFMSKQAKKKLTKPQIAMPSQQNKVESVTQKMVKQGSLKTPPGFRGSQTHFRFQGFQQNQGNPRFQNRPPNQWSSQNQGSQGWSQNQVGYQQHNYPGSQNWSERQFMQQNQYGQNSGAYSNSNSIQNKKSSYSSHSSRYVPYNNFNK